MPEMDKPASEMQKMSGAVSDARPLVAFLYVLMRDHITPGAIEDIMRNHVYDRKEDYSNGWLANHAKDIARRMGVLEGNSTVHLIERGTCNEGDHALHGIFSSQQKAEAYVEANKDYPVSTEDIRLVTVDQPFHA